MPGIPDGPTWAQGCARVVAVGRALGWEGVGLCSYLLIGFWYTDMANSAAGSKAFWYNRVGDFAFLVACSLSLCTHEHCSRMLAIWT